MPRSCIKQGLAAAQGQWLWEPVHPSCPYPIPAFHTCHTAPMAPPPVPSNPPDTQPTLQLGMCQKHLRSLLKYRLFLEELGFEGFAFFCLWNSLFRAER